MSLKRGQAAMSEQKQEQAATVGQEQPEYITVEQLAAVFSIPEKTARAWASRGIVRAVKLGGRWFIHRSELDRIKKAATAGPSKPARRQRSKKAAVGPGPDSESSGA